MPGAWWEWIIGRLRYWWVLLRFAVLRRKADALKVLKKRFERRDE
jgi:hypothetical protein